MRLKTKLLAAAGLAWTVLVGISVPALAQAAVQDGASLVRTVPTVSAFARLPFVEDARLSPDGQWIAGMFAVKGVQRLVMISPFEAMTTMAQAELPADVQVSSIHWVDNENVVLRLRTIRKYDVNDSLYVTWAVAYNRVTRKFTRLLKELNGQNTADILWIPTDGSTQILMAGQNSIYTGEDFWAKVYSVDVVKGRATLVVNAREGVLDWMADSAGAVRAGLANDRGGTQLSLLYRTGRNGAFDRVAWGKADEVDVPWWFAPGEARAIIKRKAENGNDALIEVNPETGAVLKGVFTAPSGRSIEAGHFDANDGLIGVYLGGQSEGAVHWIDPALAQLQTSFDTAVKGQRAQIVSLSANRRQMLVKIDRPDDPGRLYYYDVDDGKLRVFARLNDSISSAQTGRVSVVHYKARDGLEIEAILTKPPGREAKNLPVVVLPHGGPWANDTPTWDYWAQFIASRGYLVIQPNFRGSTGYGDDFLQKGEGQLGFAMQDDVNDALGWAAAQGLGDPKRACVMGASYGGYVAMWGASRDPDLWRCAISISGVANLRREVNDFGDYLFGRRYRQQWGRMTPDFPAVSPINFVGRINAPMLLVHGKKDLTVAHAQSQTMFAKMTAAGKNVEFLSLPLADHYFTREADRVTLLTAIEGFLAKHNPAD